MASFSVFVPNSGGQLAAAIHILGYMISGTHLFATELNVGIDRV